MTQQSGGHPMTRPSEAEVGKFPPQWSDPDNNCAQWRSRYDGLAVKCEALRQDLSPSGRESYRVALARKDAAFVEILRLAALSTPPLPSAEPVAWKVEESLDGRVYNTFWFGDDPERAERIRARMDSLGVKMTPLYTTPPAAAQDTGV